jgi:hypothetical protein
VKDDVIVQSETKQEEDMVTEIAFLSASELVDAYRRKTLSPVEVTKTVLARLEPKINAFVLVARDSALAEAEASERRWAKGSPLALSTACPSPSKISSSPKDVGGIEGRPSLAYSFPRLRFSSPSTSRTSIRIFLSGWFDGTRASGAMYENSRP